MTSPKGWGLQKNPSLIITVTGSAKEFKLKSDVQKLFYKGLIDAAVAANGIILTGVMNLGVMKHVGKAVKEYSSMNSSSKYIPCIGMIAEPTTYRGNVHL